MKKLIPIIIIISFCTSLKAQDTVVALNYCDKGSYISFDCGGGFHNIAYNLGGYGNKAVGMGFMSRVGYRFFFTRHWGVGVGLNFNTLCTTAKFDFSELQTDVEDKNILLGNKTRDLTTDYSGLKEKDKEMSLDIPVGICYQHELGYRFKIAAGANFVISNNFNQKYKTSKGEIHTIADYHFNENNATQTLSHVENIPQYGLTNYSDFSGDNDLKKTLFGVGGDVSVLFAVTPKLDLNLGVYGSYIINNQHLQQSPFLFNGENSQYNGVTQTQLSGNIHPTTMGLMCGIRYHFVRKPKPTTPPEEPQVAEIDTMPVVALDTLQVVELDSVENVAVADSLELEIVEPVPTDEELFLQAVLETGPLNFDLGKSQLPNDVQNRLDKMAEFLKAHPNLRVVVVGHTCNLGSEATNKRCGLLRANYIKNELVKRGVKPEQLEVESRWYKEPLVPNTSEANRKINRRVEFELVKE